MPVSAVGISVSSPEASSSAAANTGRKNAHIAFYQVFDGGDAPKLDGVLQPDVPGAQGPLKKAARVEGAEDDPVGYPVQKELCGQGGRCGQRGICALTLKERRPMIPLTARGKQRRRTRWSAGWHLTGPFGGRDWRTPPFPGSRPCAGTGA